MMRWDGTGGREDGTRKGIIKKKEKKDLFKSGPEALFDGDGGGFDVAAHEA